MFWHLHRKSVKWRHPQHFLNECLPPTDTHPGELGGRYGREQFYSMAGGPQGAVVLAGHSRQHYRSRLFFMGDQNRKLLVSEDGSITSHRQSIIAHITSLNHFHDIVRDHINPNQWKKLLRERDG